jgi:predicted nucleic acid-binding protein
VDEILLDSSIAVDLLNGREAALLFARKCRAAGRVLVHTVVVAELYAGASTKADFKAIDALVVTTEPIAPTEHDLSVSLTLLRRYLPPSGVEWHDCLIAATALRLGCPVATLNERHFRVSKGLKVVRPY